jgi:hypothetical protein
MAREDPKMRWLAAVGGLLLLTVPALSAPTVYISPSAVEVEEGQTVEMSIRVDAGTDTLTCFLVEFAFDASVVELLSAEEGTLFAESGHSTMFDWDEYLPGLHACNDVTLGFDAFVLCPGELVGLEFYAVEEGTTPVSITTVDLRDLRRNPILPVFTEGGDVAVVPATGVIEDPGAAGPVDVVCHPNPFSRNLNIDVGTERRADPVSVAVYDVAGREVARPDVAGSGARCHHSMWNGCGKDGRLLPGGVYFVVASTERGWARKRVTLVR